MKESKYNFFTAYKGKTICFNALSGRVFSVNKVELEYLNKALKCSTDSNPNLIKWLETNKFIVSENTDEAKQLLEKNREFVYNNKYHLALNPTLQCNFRCWYCYESHRAGHMSSNLVENIKNYVHRLVDEHKISALRLSWFGGEPLLYFDKIIYPLALHVKEYMLAKKLPFNQDITTNGYLINANMIRKFDEIGLRLFQITLDGDRETHNATRNQNGKPSFDSILNNILNLAQKLLDSVILLRINYTDEIIAKDYKQVLQIIPIELRSKIRICFQRVWQTKKEISETNENLIKNIHNLRNAGFIVVNHIYSINTFHACYADKYNYALINYDGNVYKCSARNFNTENSLGELKEDGIIQWKSDLIKKMYEKSNFENDQCMACNQLPMCGGPCLQKIVDYKLGKSKKICNKQEAEYDINSFIIECYEVFKKKCSLYSKTL